MILYIIILNTLNTALVFLLLKLTYLKSQRDTLLTVILEGCTAISNPNIVGSICAMYPPYSTLLFASRIKRRTLISEFKCKALIHINNYKHN